MIKEMIRQTTLFNGISEETFEVIFKNLSLKTCLYQKGDMAPGRQMSDPAIGIIVSGQIHAMKYLISGKSIFLRALKQGEIFGIGSVFQEEDIQLSYMEVTEKTEVIYIDEDELMKIFAYQDILKNYLTFISTKIHYLSNKIDILSQASIRERLLMYIHDQYVASDSRQIIKVPMSLSALADYLGVSRASLYRVLEILEKEDILSYEDGYIKLKRGIEDVY